jgi:hypothetical protein
LRLNVGGVARDEGDEPVEDIEPVGADEVP